MFNKNINKYVNKLLQDNTVISKDIFGNIFSIVRNYNFDNNIVYYPEFTYHRTIKPTHIFCYNCNEDFKITKVELCMNGMIVQEFDISFLNWMDIEETIVQEDMVHKLYNLEKTELSFYINAFREPLKYYRSYIRIYTSGKCDNIILKNILIFRNYIHNSNAHKDYQKLYNLLNADNIMNINQLLTTEINNYKNNTEIVFNTSKILVNGIIIKGIYYNDIESIIMNNTRLKYKKLDNDTIYCYFNKNKITKINTNSRLIKNFTLVIKMIDIDIINKIIFGFYTKNNLVDEMTLKYLYQINTINEKPPAYNDVVDTPTYKSILV